jgi:hypothetical protein
MNRKFLTPGSRRDAAISDYHKHLPSTYLIGEDAQTRKQTTFNEYLKIQSLRPISHLLPSTNRIVLKSMLSPFPLAIVGATTANKMPRPVAVDVNHVT